MWHLFFRWPPIKNVFFSQPGWFCFYVSSVYVSNVTTIVCGKETLLSISVLIIENDFPAIKTINNSIKQSVTTMPKPFTGRSAGGDGISPTKRHRPVPAWRYPFAQVKTWCVKVVVDEIEWPAQSPDLNPTEPQTSSHRCLISLMLTNLEARNFGISRVQFKYLIY